MPSQTTDPQAAAARLVHALREQLKAQLLETHISWVLLDGRHAWKIKKPLRLAFLDASELHLRRRLCEEELRLNRRLAPSIYLDVVPITGTPDQPWLDGDGPVIEVALRMKQFPAGALLSERLSAGSLQPELLDRLAARLASFQRTAEVAPVASSYGAPELIEATTLQVLDGLAQAGAVVSDLGEWLRAQADELRPLWSRRKAEGFVREGHGDLHLANLVVLDDEVTAFDCIEFDAALRWVDLQCDIAFTVMDLAARGREDLGWRFLDRWLAETADHAGLTVLRFYLVERALVRALAASLRSAQRGAVEGPDYVAAAHRWTAPAAPRLLITHGVSGSGKSFVAQGLLAEAGAVRLRSDVERKRLFGLHGMADSSAVPGGIYGAEATRRTYARLWDLAATVLRAGWHVIVDAAFLRQDEREDFHRLAMKLGVPFAILHCDAPVPLLRERVQARRARRDDPSEADVQVLERQLASQQPLQPQELAHTIAVDTSSAMDVRDLAKRWF